MNAQHLFCSLAWLLISAAVTPLIGLAQFKQDFEKLTPTWQRSETDCVVQQSKWSARRVNDDQQQNRFERIEFQTGHGTHVFVTHDVPPAMVIPELIPSVRIRSAHCGAKIFARVVLPDTPSPTGSGFMTTLVSGPAYRSNGNWQTLSFGGQPATGDDLEKRLREKVWLLRREHGQHVSTKGAYVDKIVLNLYSGPGETSIDIDDLKMDGIVSAKVRQTIARSEVVRDSKVKTVAAFEEKNGKKRSLVVRDGTVLLVKGQPFFARIIQHQGEPFEYLKALGFNTIELSATASYEQLEKASEHDLWLVCPPPSNVGLAAIPFHFDRVLAWKIGENIRGRNLPVVQQQVREIRESDQRYGRPIIGHAASNWSGLTNLTDMLLAGTQPLGTSFIASQYSDWIDARSKAVGRAKPVWADVQTELCEALVGQIKALTPKVPPIPVEPQQIKFLAYEAITGGARGLRFTSNNRLDGIDPVTQLRAKTLEWMNAELEQIEPWVAGGAMMGKLPVSSASNGDIEVTAINTSRSRLLLIQRPTHHEQYLAGDQAPRTISFQDVDSPFTDNAYLIGQTGLQSLANVRGINGTEIKIDKCPYVAAVVLTQDPLVVNRLTESFQRISKQSILQMHFELTKQWLAIQQLIGGQIQRLNRQTPVGVGALNDASAALNNAFNMMEQKSMSAAESFLNQTDQYLAIARREIVKDPLAQFQSKTSAALTAHCSLIPIHWSLAESLAAGKWHPNGLAGGDFENLQHMLSRGWQNRRTDNEAIATKVELAEDSAVDGQYGLKLTTSDRLLAGQSSELVEAAPLTIQSPPVKIRSGQMVRIHGWVNVPQAMAGTSDGLRIVDSLGGDAMAERIPITDGWREFTLYRGVAAAGELTVKFEMTGIGTASIDEVTIRAIDLPTVGPRQAKRQ